jgi:hypothetical protein
MKYNLGTTKINSGANWVYPKNIYVNQSGTWVPVQNAYVKTGGVWERIWPIPKGVFSPSTTNMSQSHYQYYPDQTSFLTITNTGDFDLTINSVVVNDSVNFSTDQSLFPAFPVTLLPNTIKNIPIKIVGNTIGTSTGSIQFINHIGYLGYANTSITTTLITKPQFSGIALSGMVPQIFFYAHDDPAGSAVPVSVRNTGNGKTLNISSITSSRGYVTSSSVTRGQTATFTVSPSSGLAYSANPYVDTITVNSDADDYPTFKIPIYVIVKDVSGVVEFDAGTHKWTVPNHVHYINLLVVGGGGGGGRGQTPYGGGGGGGGSGGYVSRRALAVTPGETLTMTVAGQSETVGVNRTPVYRVANGAWCSFLNTYGVWALNSNGVTSVFSRLWTAPYTGNYTLRLSSDNAAGVRLDGAQIGGQTGFSGYEDFSFTAAQGNRKVEVSGINYGGPAGVGAAIYDGDGNLLWSTIDVLDPNGGGPGDDTIITGSFGTVTAFGGAPGLAATEDYQYGGSTSGDGSASDGGD